ncbi:B12-binding domain-containing radical SAM protein [Prosthecochloris sp. SCSIO W1101]|uniref:B12-binding domain-containing radical SAM protein n=1 Tax=Prosthecochloris sp. SCSIO W1101 TaxID=2992242 RepID=UPI00223C9E82|nr:radical SAM protein [Prosthecochloris sp. SCSIO W1101]UZJ41068.1 B12-binding domain-containing radical SAM protein [Prosthecochloris sp. SCSIO W1101]
MSLKQEKQVILIDLISTEKIASNLEISIPKREQYTGSPTALRDPIALEYIASYLENHGFNTRILLKQILSEDEIVDIIKKNNDLIAICLSLHSTYLVPDCLSIAKKIKQFDTGIPIIVGGYHPTGDAAIVNDENIDFAVVGEGEKTSLELLQFLMQEESNSNKIESIEGISYINSKKRLVINKPRKRLEYSDLPWPKRNINILKHCHPGPLSYPPIGNVAQIAYSRGCPFSCDFCASPKMWNEKIKFREPNDVVLEMRSLILNYNINNFFFCDLSFNASKNHLIEMCKLITRMKQELCINFGSHVMCNISKIDKDILKFMSEANFLKIDYGIEDILDDTLNKIKSDQNYNDMLNILKTTNEHGILVRALIMVGYPWESKETMKRRKELIIELPVDQLRICYYVPFPGTKIYDELRPYINVPYEDFSTEVPVIECKNILAHEMKACVTDILDKFYSTESYYDHIKNKSNKFPHLKQSYLHYFKYLKSSGKLLDSPYTKLATIVSK